MKIGEAPRSNGIQKTREYFGALTRRAWMFICTLGNKNCLSLT